MDADVTAWFGAGPVPTAVVDGEHIIGHGEEIVVENPADCTELARITEATDHDIDTAVQSASQAFTSVWRGMRPVQRGKILASIASVIAQHENELARLETLDTGKPLRQARADVQTAARYFEFYAGAADKIYGDVIPGEGDYWSYTLREPFGVVAHITPWNSPLSQMCRGVAPCLAAGNTVVVKPSEITPLSSLVAARLFVEAGLPQGVCNVVVGRGPSAGAALVRHSMVSHVGFTGSVATGRQILRMAADRIVGANLELGGKSPTIVLPDADLAAAAQAGAMAVVRNAGQSCFATTRLLVHRSIADEYSQRLAGAVGRLTVGPGLQDFDLGPLASAAQLEKVVRAIESGRREGAQVIVGGGRPDLPGHFIMPAVLGGVANEMRVAQEEVFGPVQTVIVFDDLDEAIRMANDSIYGLAAGVFTRDISTAHRLARELQAGQIQINRYPLGGVETPFGGYKESGIGREKGLAAIEHYSQIKTVIVSN